MVLPDGSKHEPGTLRLCMERTISPVSMLHRGDVAGRPIGMFASAPREIETTVEEGSAHFFFQRNGDEDLALIGYAVWAGDRTTFFDMTGYAKAHEMAAIYEGPDAVVLIAGWGQGRKRR
ncbi:MAG: hypothetical protein GTO30_08490 [Acidobacteria bacterium]|nr:hypothetical protein [Acidobacteriota bacterium]NIQ86925.1 hypothetical protein [Acidobacteriota bacterium]